MRPRQKTIFKFLFVLFLITGAFLFVTTVFAQEFGVNEVGAEIALPAEDPRIVAARIIRVALGFLGIVALIIILYGGFVWMTAGGNEERIGKAKKILINGVIGLIIIIMAFSITSFIINRLLEAAGAPVGGGPGGPGGPPGGGLPSDAFLVRSIQPTGSIPIRNVVVRVVFNRNVDAASLTGNFTVKKSSDQSLVDGTTNVSGSVVEFTPTASCPPPNEDRKCFEENTEFTVEITTAVQSADGRSLICGGPAPPCRGSFTTGDLVDVAPPTIEITYPDSGQSVSADAFVPVLAHATDDAGISYLEYFANDGSLGTDAPTGPTPRDYFSSFDWDTTGITAGSRHTLTSKAFDIDTNNTTSSGVEVMVRAAHCFNGTQDEDETGLDCGGVDCGACSGSSCTSNYDCRSGFCIGGICRDLPVITGVSPSDGAPGNYITIYGRGFGSAPGSVFFADTRASLPTGCSASATWQDNQIIVQVPDIPAGEVPIRVVAEPPPGATASDYIDRTDDLRGPLLPNFDVNDIRRPGICEVDPVRGEPRTPVTVTGTQFGDTQGTSEINFGGTRAERVESWGPDSIVATVPLIVPATVPVQAVVEGQNSNPINFQVTTVAAAPQILRFEPTSGPVGEYVTIFGSNFGTRQDTVRFMENVTDADSAGILAGTNFPDACSADWWKNDQVVVKVPDGITTRRYFIRLITADGLADGLKDDTSDLSPSTFEVTVGTPKPGICLLNPDNGPATTPVTLGGERFGSSGTVKFWQNITATVDPGDWTDTQITTSVPTGAETGPVNVTVGTVASNNVNFAVRDCRTSTPQCDEPGWECCANGSCAPAGGCVAPAGRGYYFWQFSTGTIPVFPQVVEECTGRFPPPSQRTPSPMPWQDRGQTSVCVNAKISARFTTEIDLTTLTAENIQVYPCVGAEPNPCNTLADRPLASDRISSQNSGRPDYQGSFDFIPRGGLWAQNSWYQITLKDNITSVGGFQLDGDKDGEEGGDYVFRFKTRDSPDLCRVGGVGVRPPRRTAEEENEMIAYQGDLWAEGDACLLIDGRGYAWNWRVRDPASPPRGRLFAEIDASGGYTLDNSDPPNKVTRNLDGSPAGPDQTVATAREETVPGQDVQVVGRIPSEGVEGGGDLKIDFTDPKVVEKWPDCSDACVNAEIGVRFNTRMNTTSGDPRSVTNPTNSKLYVWRCGNGVLEAGEDCDDGNARSGDGCSERCVNEGSNLRYGSTCGNGRRETGEDCDGVPFPGGCSTTCLNTGSVAPAVCGNSRVEEGEDCDGGLRCSSATDPRPCTNLGADALSEVNLGGRSYFALEKKLILAPSVWPLEPNTFYRVILSGNIASASGVSLTDLNYDARSPAGNDSYSWAFKTKDDANPCAVDRVALAPKEATLTWIGATQNYISTPFSAPDVCSQNGQRLRSLDYDWNWSSADPVVVADVTNNNNYPKCGNKAIEFGEDCDDGNTLSGDGCDTNCLNEGSVGAARCGNSEVERGEDCDDGNARSGDGCNSRCLHEGSVAGGSVCGDGLIGTGEDCDDGNTTAGDGCNNTCLNEGTVTDGNIDPYQVATARGLKESDVAAGNKESTTQISAAEPESTETDSGDLTVRCDFGLQEGGRTYRDCPTVACDLGTNTCENSAKICSTNADCALGVGRDTCCHFKPKVQTCSPSGVTDGCASRTTPDVCRNAKISVTFDQLMDPASVTGNIFVVSSYEPITDPCPGGTAPLALVPEVPVFALKNLPNLGEKLSLEVIAMIRRSKAIPSFLQWTGLPHRLQWLSMTMDEGVWQINDFLTLMNKLSEILFGKEVLAQTPPPPRSNTWCVWPGPVTTLTVGAGEGARTKVNFSPSRAFDGDREYRVVVLGDNPETPDVEGIKSLKGVAMRGTSPSGEFAVTRTIGNKQVYSWTFRTSGDICALSKVVVDPEFWLFGRVFESKTFEADAQDARGNSISGLPAVYDWSWSWAKGGSDPTVLSDLRDTGRPEQKTVDAQNKNGEAKILATAAITADTILTPSTVGRTKIGSADVIVFLCENPWPPATFPLEDKLGNDDGIPPPYYNFKTYYCRDRGAVGMSDDLPTLGDFLERDIVRKDYSPRDPRKDELLREYFFFNRGSYCTLSKMPCEAGEDCGPAGGSCQRSPDAIGVRIYENAEHRTLADWYLAQGFRYASPAVKTIDGYEAIQDGRTIYVSAANKSGSLYTNVYLISYNDGAHPDTIEIYNQLVNNWKFNINLSNNKLCKNPGVDGVLGTSDDGNFNVGADETQVICSSDLDCPQFTVGGTSRQSLCEAPKDKLARDMKRLLDLEIIKTAVESYKRAKGYPPKLEAGTYVRGITNSKWDSWAGALGRELGASLPTDPLNKFTGCTDPYSADTCWSLSEQTYKCPVNSHIYQYKFIPATGLYEIGTDLEYHEVDGSGRRVEPSYSWFTAIGKPIPGYIRYENTCNASAIYRTTGTCGDRIINASEECEVGQTRERSCYSNDDGRDDGRQSQMCDLATCRWPTEWTACLINCGNGILDALEVCDRGPGGGRIPGGGISSGNQYNCTGGCAMSDGYCGDGAIKTAYGERCDDGTAPDGTPYNGRYGFKPGTTTPYCAIGCVGPAPYCGDSVTTTPQEQCDSNSITSKGVCLPSDKMYAPDSRIPDYFVPCERNEDCPPPEPGVRWICSLCPAERGTGYPQFRTLACESTCERPDLGWGTCSLAGARCGNGIPEGSEQCDDGNVNNNDSCTNACQNARCGDSYVRTGVEMCDAGGANGRICAAPYGSTCNYCSAECTLRTASGPTCGDGTVNGPEQCDGRVPTGAGINWICVETANPWARVTTARLPTCSPSACQLTCAAGRACNNSPATPDTDLDGISDVCDTNDDSATDGCLDDERNCAVVSLAISAVIPAGRTSPDDTFEVYIDRYFVGLAGQESFNCRFSPITLRIECDYRTKTITINGLTRGLHNLRIVYTGTTSRTVEGIYEVGYIPGTLDWGIDVFHIIPRPSPPLNIIGAEVSRDFEVR